MTSVKIVSFFLGFALLSGGVMASNDARDPKQMTLTQPMVKTLVMETVQQGADTLMVPYHQAVKIGAFDVASNDEGLDSGFPIPNVVFECEGKPLGIGSMAFPRGIRQIEFNQCSQLSILEDSFGEQLSKQSGKLEGAAAIQRLIINNSQLNKDNCKIRLGGPVNLILNGVGQLPRGFLKNQTITTAQGLDQVKEIGEACFFNAQFSCRPLVGFIKPVAKPQNGRDGLSFVRNKAK